MVLNEYSISHVPYARDVKKEKANFFGGVVPGWLTLNSNAEINSNGVFIGNGDISTCYFNMEGVCACEFTLNNLRYSSITLCLINPTLGKRIHFKSIGETFEYSVNNVTVFSKSIKDSKTILSGSLNAIRPKNISIIVQPSLHQIDLLFNDYVVFNIDTKEANIDFEGDWGFYAYVHDCNFSSVEFGLQQNR